MSKPEIKPKKTSIELKKEKMEKNKSELSNLHNKYKSMTSDNLNKYFNDDKQRFIDYHKISKENECSFPKEEIPRNKMIKYLDNLPSKKKKFIADLGCGFAEIYKYFKNSDKFEFKNFDHCSLNEYVISRDIMDTKLDDNSMDIAILSLAMWGSNCKDYIKEAYRILDKGGILLIAEPFKRWNEIENDKLENKLINLLTENNFIINYDTSEIDKKFMFIECMKTNY